MIIISNSCFKQYIVNYVVYYLVLKWFLISKFIYEKLQIITKYIYIYIYIYIYYRCNLAMPGRRPVDNVSQFVI